MDIKSKANNNTNDEEVVFRRNPLSSSARDAANRQSRDSYLPPEDMDRPDPNQVPIDMAGTLHKKGRRLKVWKQRYFEIQGTNMYSYKNNKTYECLGYIDLTKLYFVGQSTATSFGVSFELQTMDRVHLLAARNEVDMNRWISVIKTKMGSEAKVRDKRGTKEAVQHHVVSTLGDNERRRATIKYRGGITGGGAVNRGRPKPFISPAPISEEAELPPQVHRVPIKSSQTLPTVSSQAVVDNPPTSDSNMNSLENFTIDDLPSPDEILATLPPPIVGVMTTPGEFVLPPNDDFMADLPSPQSIGIPPGSFDLPPPLSSSSPLALKPVKKGSPILAAPDAFVDSDVVKELRELVERDDSYWKITDNSIQSLPIEEKWLKGDSAILQLKQFLGL